MTAPQTFSPNFRLLPKGEQDVPEVPADDDFAPPRYRTVTRSAILAANPRLRYLADPAQPSREPTEDEAAAYGARRDDPDWAWLYILAGERHPDPEAHPYPAPAAEPEPIVVAGFSRPEEEPAEPPDATRVIEPAVAETEVVAAVKEEGGESDA